MDNRSMGTLLQQPLKLIQNIRSSENDLDSYKQECNELISCVKTLGRSLHKVRTLLKDGSPRFCYSFTSAIIEEASRSLEKCCFLLGKCKKGAFLRRIVTITSSNEFRRVKLSIEEATANVGWLIECVTDEDITSFISMMPPITLAFPNLAIVWANLSKIHGGGPELREAASVNLALLSRSSEQNLNFILEQGGVAELVKVLHEGTPKAKLHAAETIGNLADGEIGGQTRARLVMSQNGVITALLSALGHGQMELQAKVAWAIAKISSQDMKSKEEFGLAGFINPLVGLMLEAIDDAKMCSRRSRMPELYRGKASVISASTSSKWMGETKVTTNETNADLFSTAYTQPYQNGHENEPHLPTLTQEARTELKVQVTQALWTLAMDNVENCRRIAETRAMLDFAKLVEIERGEVQMNALKAITALAEVAEQDVDFRKFAFKKTSAASKTVMKELLRLTSDVGIDTSLQVLSIRAIGCLANVFSMKEAKDNKIHGALVSKLCQSDKKHLPVVKEAVFALLKFVEDDNFLRKEHSGAILDEGGCLPYLVQFAVLDADKNIQIPAILLLTELALHVGRMKGTAFQEAATLSVLKSVAHSSKLTDHIKGLISKAIYYLEFCGAGGVPAVIP